VVVNEIMSSNSSTITDGDGDHSDWIEIYNDSEHPVNLDGFGLSDSEGNPFKWVFPDVSIQSGDYLLIWASNKNRRVPGAPLHANFAISADGEMILLTAPDSTLMDSFQSSIIGTDISMGRKPDGSGELFFFTSPTPGSANNTEGHQNPLDPVIFSLPGGFYN